MKVGDIITCSNSLDMIIKAQQLQQQGVYTIFKSSNILEVTQVA